MSQNLSSAAVVIGALRVKRHILEMSLIPGILVHLECTNIASIFCEYHLLYDDRGGGGGYANQIGPKVHHLELPRPIPWNQSTKLAEAVSNEGA